MTKKTDAQKPKHIYFLKSSVECYLLERIQNEGRSEVGKESMIDLTISYLWFINRLAQAYTPKKAHENVYIEHWSRIFDIFQNCARIVPLLEDVCFLEYVLESVDKEFNVERKKRLEKIRNAVAADQCNHLDSLDAEIWKDGEKTLCDMISKQVGKTPDEEIWQEQLTNAFKSWCASLTKQEAAIVRMLHGPVELSIQDVACSLGISKDKVHQKYQNAIRKLRNKKIIHPDFRIAD